MLAHVSEHCAKEQRMRRFAWVVTAMMTGSLAGPYLGGLATQPEAWVRIGLSQPPNFLIAPVLAGAFISSLALIGLYFVLRRQTLTQPALPDPPATDSTFRPAALYMLFALSIFIMYAVGVFEVGLSTLARQNLRLDGVQLGMMYTECALVMMVMQALFFADPFKNFANRHLLFPAFVLTAGALALFPMADTYGRLAWVVAVIASGAGVIAPLISYRVSVVADGRQGKNFGLQSASANLGQALGSAGSGMLLGLNPQLPYWLAAAVLLAGALWILLSMPLRPYVFEA
jgi:predicted MFS family arabinose efflux permease